MCFVVILELGWSIQRIIREIVCAGWRFEFADKAFLRPKPKTAIYIRAQYPLKIQRAEFLYVTMNSLQVFACTIDSEGAIFHWN